MTYSRIRPVVDPVNNRTGAPASGAPVSERRSEFTSAADLNADSVSHLPPAISHPLDPSASYRSTVLRIEGLQQIKDILRIEQAIASQPGIGSVEPINFADGTLMLRIEHHIDQLAQVVSQAISLPIESAKEDDGWIEVRLGSGNAGKK